MTDTTSGRRHRLLSPGGGFLALVDESGSRVASLVDTTTGTELLLQMPGRDVEAPARPAVADSNRLWHERFAGGWHTLLPNAGDHRVVDGVEHAFHGEAAWLLWHTVSASPSAVTLEVTLHTVPLVLTRTTEATDTGLRITQTVRNTSDRPVAFTWTEHPSLSAAVVDPAAVLSVGDETLDVRFPAAGEQHGAFRSVATAGRDTARLRGPAGETALHWDPALFSHLHVWQEHRATAGFPWFGATDTVALEPASRPYETVDDRLGPVELAGHASVTAGFALEFTPTERPS